MFRFTETTHTNVAGRLVIAHANGTSHVFVYVRVNGGSGVTLHGCCGHDMRRHKVLVDLCLLDGLWLLCNRPQQQLSPCQPEESRD